MSEVNELSLQDFSNSILAMNVLDAEDKLWQLRVSQFPNTKQPSQERLIKDLRKITDQGREKSSVGVISNEQLAKILAQR